MMVHRVVILCAMAAAVAGCQADPKIWRGGQKFFNVHAVAFTPQGHGLVMVGPRRGGDDQPNATSYYYLDLDTMIGRRLGYGQYSLGQALLCPFEEAVAVPAYFSQFGTEAGYDLYDLASGERIRRVAIDSQELFLPHAREPLLGIPASQPDQSRLLAAWRRVWPDRLTLQRQTQVRDLELRWLTRVARPDPSVKAETMDGQRYFVLESQDRRYKLFIRFQPPSSNPLKADDASGTGYAYGFLQNTRTFRRYMLFTTTGSDEFFDRVGSAVVEGPVWLFQQPIKWFRGTQ